MNSGRRPVGRPKDPRSRSADKATFHQGTVYVDRKVWQGTMAKLALVPDETMSSLVERLLRDYLDRA